MATFTKTILSGSTDGRGIKVGETATPGTLLHTGPTSTSTLHEVWLWAVNSDATASKKLTIEFGGTSAPDDTIEINGVASESGLLLVVPGLILKGNATPLVVRAFAATTNLIMVHGFVNVIA